MTTTYKAPRQSCAVCGSDEQVKTDGTLRAHREMRMGRSGQYRSRHGCDGSGQPPESAEAQLEPVA